MDPRDRRGLSDEPAGLTAVDGPFSALVETLRMGFERVSLEDLEPSEAADGVNLALMAGTDSMNVQHFEIEPGATVDEHSHPHDQTGYITQGELTFLVEGEEIVCGPGDSYAIPGDQPHAAENRGDETVRGVDIFSPPRKNPSWQDD